MEPAAALGPKDAVAALLAPAQALRCIGIHNSSHAREGSPDMKLRILTVLALAAALTACDSDSATKGANDGAGMGGVGTGGVGMGSVTPGTQSDLAANVGDRVFFDFNSYSVRPDARATLDRQAAWLKRYPQLSVVIEGHADERGTREYNLALGDRRANSVRDYLASQGIPSSRVRTVSFGKERPLALGSNEEAWAQNRRGMTVVQ